MLLLSCVENVFLLQALKSISSLILNVLNLKQEIVQLNFHCKGYRRLKEVSS